MKRIIAFLFSVVMLYSCDCLQRVQGFVYDAENLEPLSGAMISKDFGDNTDFIDNRKVYSTAEGEFEYMSIAGALFGCPRLRLMITRVGYDTLNVESPRCCTDIDTVYMKPIRDSISD